MGYDLANWSPMIPGDPNYTIPGATKLGGVVDTTNDRVKYIVGQIPTLNSSMTWAAMIAAINGTTGINQIIGLINARIIRWNKLFGSVLPQASYIQPGLKQTAINFTNVFNALNSIRIAEGFPAYVLSVVPGTPVSNVKELGSYISDLRRGCRIAGSVTFTLVNGGILANGVSRAFYYTRYDKPLGTIDSPNGETLAGVGFVGVSATGGINPGSGHVIDVQRNRILFSVPVPDYAIGGAAGLTLTVGTSLISGTINKIFYWYYSDTDDSNPINLPSGAGSAYNTNHIMSSLSPFPGHSTQVLPGAAAIYAAAAGRRFSSILVESDDRFNTIISGETDQIAIAPNASISMLISYGA